MRKLFVTAFAVIFAWALSIGIARANELTDQQAYTALSQYLAADKVRVIGVQMVPAYGAAVADFHVVNLRIQLPKNDLVTARALGPGGSISTESGDGQAVFKEYTDGRWQLHFIKFQRWTFSPNVMVTP